MNDNHSTNYQPQRRAMTEEEIRTRQTKRRQEAMKKRKKQRTIFFSACAAILILLILGIVLLCRSCSSGKANDTLTGSLSSAVSDSRIVGSYILSDDSCTYVFKEDATGYLQLTGGSQYEFNYILKDDTLSIDFKSSAITDSKYTVAFKSDGITLTAVEGTISPGTEYKLNKMP